MSSSDDDELFGDSGNESPPEADEDDGGDAVDPEVGSFVCLNAVRPSYD